MSNSNLLTFRCPDDLREAIAGLMADTSKDRTAVVTMLLRLGLAAYNSGQTDVIRCEQGVVQVQAVPTEETVQTIVASMLQGVQQRLTEVEQRLGEFERLKAEQEQNLATDSGSYIEPGTDRTAESNDYQQVLVERDQLEERVSDLLLEVENLKDENAVLKQTATDVGPIEPQSGEGLREISDRFLITLKPLERKTAAKLLSRFLKFVGADSHSPTA
jgi:hypothetical protein